MLRAYTIRALAVLLVALAATVHGLHPREVPSTYHSFSPSLKLRHHLELDARGAFKPLTTMRGGSSESIAMEFLASKCRGSQWAVTSSYTTRHNGITHVYLTQMAQNLAIANSYANVNIDAKGRVLNAGETCADSSLLNFARAEASISAKEAIAKLAAHLGLVATFENAAVHIREDGANKKYIFSNTGFALADIPVDQTYLLLDHERSPVLTWHMEVQLADNWFDAHVCANTGEVLSMIDWVSWDSYEVYAIPNLDPRLGDRVKKVNPFDGNASPKGWLDQGLGSGQFTTTVGNNVYAQLNPANLRSFTYNFRSDGDIQRTFDFPIDFAQNPYKYKEATIANLFFWNNVMHDIFYLAGFDEVAGNFQENNFGKGGLAVDAVEANAQDGSGFNNANFATPPDGQRPRMRMYLWDWSSPMTDGDLDSGVIVHEYGHGISTRLTGGPANSNCLYNGQAGGMGEGWGDWWATIFTMKPDSKPTDAFPMGEYAAGRGIRPYPYSTDFAIDPQTYGFLNQATYSPRTSVHAKGSVWCSILFEVYWSVVTKYGFDPDWYYGRGGNNIIFQNVVDGLKLQPCNPSFLDARDAIILADTQNHGGKHVCDMWAAFAKRGLGFSASTADNNGPVTEAFNLPSFCASTNSTIIP